jgi:hypothetical protein
MFKRNFTLVVLLSCFVHAQAQEDVSLSRWMKQQIVIDGNDNDWGEPLNFFDNASGMIFTMANDGKNIYLCFSNNDRVHTGKMMAAGWSVELSSSEKKRKFEAALSFPRVTDPAIAAKADMKSVVGAYRNLVPAVEAKGLLSNTSSIPLNAKEGLSIAIGTDSTDKIVYEIRIPVKELMEEDKLQLNELITLTISVNALEKNGEHASGNGGAGVRGGGMRNSGVGNRGGFNGAPSRAAFTERPSLYEKTSFKQKIKLSTQSSLQK